MTYLELKKLADVYALHYPWYKQILAKKCFLDGFKAAEKLIRNENEQEKKTEGFVITGTSGS